MADRKRYALLLSLLLVGASVLTLVQHTPLSTAAALKQDETVEAHRAAITQSLSAVQSQDANAAAAALQILQDATTWPGLGAPLADAVVRATVRAEPGAMQPPDNVVRALMAVASAHANAIDISVLREVFAQQTPVGRAASLGWLCASDHIAASKYLAELMGGGLLGAEGHMVLTEVSRRPHHPAILLPPMWSMSPPADFTQVVLATLSFARANLLPAYLMAPQRNKFVERYRQVRDSILAQAQDADAAPRWRQDYLTRRTEAQSLLHLFAFLPVDWSDAEINQALTLADPSIALSAVQSRLQQGLTVAADVVARLAADAQTRRALVESLHEFDQLALCPTAYTSEQALAESDLVTWLTYPTELGRTPDAIEYVQSVIISEDNHPATYYVFRFTSRKHAAAGWMAGISGPFPPPEGEPALFATGSHFTAMDSQSPEEHVKSALATLRAFASTLKHDA